MARCVCELLKQVVSDKVVKLQVEAVFSAVKSGQGLVSVCLTREALGLPVFPPIPEVLGCWCQCSMKMRGIFTSLALTQLTVIVASRYDR